jgi:AcrR family transcriptional regulator
VPRPPNDPLTPDELYRRALAIVDDEGLEALTMRRLASDVGVKAPSLYNHVTGKEQLIDGALRVMRAELRFPDPLPDNWMALMEAVFSEYRRVLQAHPHLMPLAGRRLEGDDDSGIEYLVEQGFSLDRAVGLWQSLAAVAVGFTMFASGYTETDVRGLPDDVAARVSEWRNDTYTTALRTIMEAYERDRGAD